MIAAIFSFLPIAAVFRTSRLCLLANVLAPLYVIVLVKRMEREKTFELRAAHFEAVTKRDLLTGLLNAPHASRCLQKYPHPNLKTGDDISHAAACRTDKP